MISAPTSGAGKTTVATGLMAALRAAGYDVSGHKAGPDYIDPGYHSLATGRPGRNLDVHLHGENLLGPLLLHGASHPRPADLAVIEGMMGLYDGKLGGRGFASTAHVAALLDAPVVLVVDVSHVSRSAAAIVAGMAVFDQRIRIAGVILNRVGSRRHAAEVASAVEDVGVPVLGALRHDSGLAVPSRHLGLVPAEERAEAVAAVELLAERIAAQVDLTAVVEVARSAPPLHAQAWSAQEALRAAGFHPVSAQRDHPVVAVAGGQAFTFRYAEVEELLRAAGCRPVVFDPMSDPALPDGTAGIYLGGGFPEVYAAELAGNTALRTALRDAVRSGVPTVAECAGLLYLCRDVDGAPMVGALDAVGRMTSRLALGYYSALAPAETLVAAEGDRVPGHTFHRTTVTSTGEQAGPAWLLDGQPDGFSSDPAGIGRPTLHASYLHTHWAGCPQAAARFAAAVSTQRPC